MPKHINLLLCILLNSVSVLAMCIGDNYDEVEWNASGLQPLTIYANAEEHKSGFEYFEYFAHSDSLSIHDIILYGNYQQLVDRLNKRPQEIHQLDAQGNTPLHTAARSLSYKKVDLLLKNGADPFVLNNDQEDAAEVMPVYNLGSNIHKGILNIMQPQFVIQALLELTAMKHPYEINDTDGAVEHCTQHLISMMAAAKHK